LSVAKHTTYNVIGAVVPIAVSLVTVPLYLKLIGLDRYGILSLCWLLVGYFSFFDFGLGRATAQHIARLHEGAAATRSQAFWTGLTLSAGLALLAVLVATPLGWIALNALKVGTPQLRGETQAALPLLIAAVPLAIIQSVLKGALEGRRQFFAVNAILSGGAVATGVLPLIAAATWGPAIPLLVAISLGVRGMVLAGLAITAVLAVPVRRYQRPDPDDIRSMMRFGAWLTVTNVIGPLMIYVDRFLIGAIVGTAAVSLYVIPFNLISQLLVLPSALGVALFPRFAASDTSSGLSSEALIATTFLLTPVAMAAMLVVGPFLRLWLGESVSLVSTPVAIVLIIGFWANGLAQLPYSSLQANGRTDLTAKVHLAEILPYLLLLWLGVSYVGVIGAAIAWSVRGAVDFVALALLDRVGAKALQTASTQAIAIVALALVMFETGLSPIAKWTLVGVICLGTAGYLARTVPRNVLVHARRWIAPLWKWLPQ
jgi:O-antigen/teichoic acid export membrane protein